MNKRRLFTVLWYAAVALALFLTHNTYDSGGKRYYKLLGIRYLCVSSGNYSFIASNAVIAALIVLFMLLIPIAVHCYFVYYKRIISISNNDSDDK